MTTADEKTRKGGFSEMPLLSLFTAPMEWRVSTLFALIAKEAVDA
jgi:hypothetical protein